MNEYNWLNIVGSPNYDERGEEEMDNLALQIIDEEVQEGFTIDNDNLAEWALKKISEERAESQRYINVCETMINDYRLKVQKEQEKLENKTGYLKAKLQEYFATVPHKATKTQETYKLPSGTLKVKYGTPEFKVENETLVKWLKDTGLTDYIKTEEKAQWGELKKTVTVSFDKVLSADGEVIDGITVNERTNTFEVEL